ncbi:unnamed protein product [Gadus morhua 'NCC']
MGLPYYLKDVAKLYKKVQVTDAEEDWTKGMAVETQPPAHNKHSPGNSDETPIQTPAERSTPCSRYGRPLKPNPKYNT